MREVQWEGSSLDELRTLPFRSPVLSHTTLHRPLYIRNT
jgi:hypothetical protein